MALGKRQDGLIAGISPIRKHFELDVIDEDGEESGPFKDQSLVALRSSKKTVPQDLGCLIKLHEMKVSLLDNNNACNFSDLSSI